MATGYTFDVDKSFAVCRRIYNVQCAIDQETVSKQPILVYACFPTTIDEYASNSSKMIGDNSALFVSCIDPTWAL